MDQRNARVALAVGCTAAVGLVTAVVLSGGSSGDGASGAVTTVAAVPSGSPATDADVKTVDGLQSTCAAWTSRVTAELDVSIGTQTVKQSATIKADPRAGSEDAILTSDGGLDMEQILVGTTLYMRQSGQSWYSMDVKDNPAALSHGPCDEFAVFEKTEASAVGDLGSASVGSAAVHRLRIHGPAWYMLSTTPVWDPQPLDQLSQDDRPADAVVDVDSDGRPVRFTVAVTFTSADGQPDETMSYTEAFSDFGAPADITVPDSSQVTDQAPPGFSAAPALRTPSG